MWRRSLALYWPNSTHIWLIVTWKQQHLSSLYLGPLGFIRQKHGFRNTSFFTLTFLYSYIAGKELSKIHYEANRKIWHNHSSTHWGRVTHICVSKLTIIGSDNGLSPRRRQAIIGTNAGILLIWPLGTKFSEILIETHMFSFKKIRLKVSSAKVGHFVLASMC